MRLIETKCVTLARGVRLLESVRLLERIRYLMFSDHFGPIGHIGVVCYARFKTWDGDLL